MNNKGLLLFYEFIIGDSMLNLDVLCVMEKNHESNDELQSVTPKEDAS